MLTASLEDLGSLGKNWKWLVATGVLYIILGVIAFSMPVASTIGLTFALGIILLIGGGFHLVHAFQLRHHHGAPTRFLQSAIAIITGALMLRYPGGGMLALAMALSFYFFVSAAAQWLLFISVYPHSGSAWGLVSSVISFLLGVFIVVTFPFSAVWVPGLLLGIDLLFGGAAMIALAMSIRQPASTRRTSSGMHPSPA